MWYVDGDIDGELYLRTGGNWEYTGGEIYDGSGIGGESYFTSSTILMLDNLMEQSLDMQMMT